MTDIVLQAKNLRKTFLDAGKEIAVLENINLDVKRGEKVSIIGSSGSGKTTLLQMLGGLESPTAGKVILSQQSIGDLNEGQRGDLRNRSLGFVYQFHHLLPEFSALDNVAMPLFIRRDDIQQARDEAADILQRVGLGHRLDHKPGQLSGGERQRAAIARALVTKPDCVLADEPTGNLDRGNAQQVLALMNELNTSLGISFVIVTHDLDIARGIGQSYELLDGQLANYTQY